MSESLSLPDDTDRLQALLRERDARREAVDERDTEIRPLREYVRLLKSERFGSSSERSHRSQLGLFNEAEVLAETLAETDPTAPGITVAEHTRKPRGRKPLPAWMPREEILHDLE